LHRILALCAVSASVVAIIGGVAIADDETAPSPASIGADIPLSYFGPPPSSVQPELIGPVQLLESGTVDADAGTVTLPLYQGRMVDGKKVWYILTDTTDEANAAALGINHSSKLAYAGMCGASRTARLDADGMLVFNEGTVDFAPERKLTPGAAPNPFPPAEAVPGSVGDASYSPLVVVENAGGHIYNAPIVAFGHDEADLDFCTGAVDHTKVHDKVVQFCPSKRTVTMALTSGFSFSRPVLYLSTESNSSLAATLEGATLAPGLNDVPVGGDDSAFSAVERIFVMINGPRNPSPNEIHPYRQGLESAILDGRSPLNVLGGIPTIATDYSPLWDMNLGEWTADAIAKGYRARVTEEFQILGLAVRGHITGPGGAPYGSSGIIVNCPIVQRLL
jgi:hypothetical protein